MLIVRLKAGRLPEGALGMHEMTRLNITRSTTIALIAVAMSVATAPARAAELLMLEEAGCMWCERWNEEIGVIYDRTKEGRLAPLRRVDVHDRLPADLRNVNIASYTPTFVLIDDGKEIGRILGYPGEDFFWGLLHNLLRKLPDGRKIDFTTTARSFN